MHLPLHAHTHAHAHLRARRPNAVATVEVSVYGSCAAGTILHAVPLSSQRLETSAARWSDARAIS
eukprot:6197839-Pleurochrysis_carterae.AAC.5